MTYSKDPNQIASEFARREEREALLQPPRRVPPAPAALPTGTLSVWTDIANMAVGRNPIHQSEGITLDLSRPGLVIAVTPANGDVEVFVTQPGWYINFVPDRREGE